LSPEYTRGQSSKLFQPAKSHPVEVSYGHVALFSGLSEHLQINFAILAVQPVRFLRRRIGAISGFIS
jgi:hypothetical protein